MKLQIQRDFFVTVELDIPFGDDELENNLQISVAVEKMSYAVEQAVRDAIQEHLDKMTSSKNHDYDGKLKDIYYGRKTKVEVKYFE